MFRQFPPLTGSHLVISRTSSRLSFRHRPVLELLEQRNLLSFGSPIYYNITQNNPGGYNPESIAVGDFNGDGILDMITANSGPLPRNDDGTPYPTVSVLLGQDNQGHFQTPPTSYQLLNAVAAFPEPKWADPESVVVGDFNGDGKLDFAVAVTDITFYGAIEIWLGNGDGTFTFKQVLTVNNNVDVYPIWLALGDFNNDGKVDLAVANNKAGEVGNGSVSVFLGNGDGTFQNGITSDIGDGSNPYSIAVGDFNGDGKLDLAVGASLATPFGSTNNLEILLGNGDGTFPVANQIAYQLPGGPGDVAVAVADFNGDTHQDIALSISDQNVVEIFLGNGDGTFQAPIGPYQVGISPKSVAIGDFDGDGILDLAVANQDDNPGTVTILHGNGDGTFMFSQTLRDTHNGTGPVHVAILNYTMNYQSLAVADEFSNEVSVWVNTPPPAPFPAAAFDSSADQFAALGSLGGSDVGAFSMHQLYEGASSEYANQLLFSRSGSASSTVNGEVRADTPKGQVFSESHTSDWSYFADWVFNKGWGLVKPIWE